MTTQKFGPTEYDINEAEARVLALKKAREEAKEKLIAQLRDIAEEIPEKLSLEDSVGILDLLRKKLMSGATSHKKVRGHPVPGDLRNNLEKAIKSEQYTMAQLEELFGVSISYIAKLKKELGLTRPPVRVDSPELQTA